MIVQDCPLSHSKDFEQSSRSQCGGDRERREKMTATLLGKKSSQKLLFVQPFRVSCQGHLQ